MTKSLNWKSGKAAIQAIKDGSVTLSEVTESCLKQIDKFEKSLHAWAYLDKDVLYKEIDIIQSTFQSNESPLFGLPIGVKDIFNTKNMPTQMGSPLWKDFMPGNDSRVVDSLRRSGALILGKTETAEFGVHYQDKTCNPHNTCYSPGTSSSGSAAAVASGMVFCALATQTAGSIIRPSSYCGIYGMKPSFGILPRTGTLKTTDSLDTIGFMSRSADDLHLLFDSMRVKGRNYEFVHKHIDAYKKLPADKTIKIGFIEHSKWHYAEKYAKDELQTFLSQLSQSKNIQIEEVKFPSYFEEIHDLHQCIYDKTLAYYFKEEFKQHHLVSPIMYDIIERGNQVTLSKYKEALKLQAEYSQEFDRQMRDFDAFITLSTSGSAPEGLTTEDKPDSCLVWTFLGLPVINIPQFTSPQNLPFGVQLIGRKYSDPLLLDILSRLKTQSLINDVAYDL